MTKIKYIYKKYFEDFAFDKNKVNSDNVYCHKYEGKSFYSFSFKTVIANQSC